MRELTIVAVTLFAGAMIGYGFSEIVADPAQARARAAVDSTTHSASTPTDHDSAPSLLATCESARASTRALYERLDGVTTIHFPDR